MGTEGGPVESLVESLTRELAARGTTHWVERLTLDSGGAAGRSSGKGSVPVAADQIQLRIHIHSFGDSPAEAANGLADVVDWVMALMDELNLDASSRSTSKVERFPNEEVTHIGPNGERFSCRLQIRGAVPDDSAARVVTERARARSTDTVRIHTSVTYHLAKDNPARLEAMKRAVDDATTAIRENARDNGFTPGPLVQVAGAGPTVGGPSGPVNLTMDGPSHGELLPKRPEVDVFAAATDCNHPPAVPSGIEVDVQARCTLTYRLINASGDQWPIAEAEPIAVVDLPARRNPDRWTSGDRAERDLYPAIAVGALERTALLAKSVGMEGGQIVGITELNHCPPRIRIERELTGNQRLTHFETKPVRRIVASGSGEVEIAPDHVEAAFLITSRDDSHDGALSRTRDGLARVFALLDGWNVAPARRNIIEPVVHARPWNDATNLDHYFIALAEARFDPAGESLPSLRRRASGLISRSLSLRDPGWRQTQIDLVFIQKLSRGHLARSKARELASADARANALSLATAFDQNLGFPTKIVDITQPNGGAISAAHDSELIVEAYLVGQGSCGVPEGDSAPQDEIVEVYDTEPRLCISELEVEFILTEP